MYIGLIGRDETATLAANPHLRLMFGWPPDAAPTVVRPLAADRFVDEQARGEFLQQLSRDGQVHAYLLRLAARRRLRDVGRGHRPRRAPACRPRRSASKR